MKFGLLDSDIEMILGAVSQFPEIRQVVIFGSRAKGNYLKGSDIDLSLTHEEISQNS